MSDFPGLAICEGDVYVKGGAVGSCLVITRVCSFERGTLGCWIHHGACVLVDEPVYRAGGDIAGRSVYALYVSDLVEFELGADVFGDYGEFVDVGE